VDDPKRSEAERDRHTFFLSPFPLAFI